MAHLLIDGQVPSAFVQRDHSSPLSHISIGIWQTLFRTSDCSSLALSLSSPYGEVVKRYSFLDLVNAICSVVHVHLLNLS